MIDRYRSWLNWMSGISLLSAVIFLIVVGYWMLYPYKVITFNDSVFPMSTKVAKAGQIVSYKVDYCKTTDLSSSVTREFVNALIYVTPTTINHRPKGCHVFTMGVVVHKELPPGEYYLHMTYRYKVNPIKEIIVEHNTEKFTVTK